MFYLVKTPWWLKKFYSSFVWDIKTPEKVIYLSFDDGPEPEITPFVLKELKNFDALGTFFCIGQNVVDYPDLYKQIIDEGHAVGNHTQNHLNGWHVNDEAYLKDVLEASHHIDSALFRPPYGKITKFQAKQLPAAMKGANVKVIMWDVVSGDFDETIPPQRCLENVLFNAVAGSIVVFHDSKKAFPRMEFALPRVLEYFSKKGFSFGSLK